MGADSLNQSLSAQERLHSLLSSYVSEGEEGEEEEGEGRRGRGWSPYRVRFKPPRGKAGHKSGEYIYDFEWLHLCSLCHTLAVRAASSIMLN